MSDIPPQRGDASLRLLGRWPVWRPPRGQALPPTAEEARGARGARGAGECLEENLGNFHEFLTFDGETWGFFMEFYDICIFIIIYCWLVVSNMNFIFHFIYGIILSIDELIFFRGVGTPPTRYNIYIYIYI